MAGAIKTANFAPGQIVKHRKLGYRGVIFDVDAEYSQSPEWYEMMGDARPAKNAPWYHVMVDGEVHTTYVAEENLQPCVRDHTIEHPMINKFFDFSQSGAFESRAVIN